MTTETQRRILSAQADAGGKTRFKTPEVVGQSQFDRRLRLLRRQPCPGSSDLHAARRSRRHLAGSSRWIVLEAWGTYDIELYWPDALL